MIRKLIISIFDKIMGLSLRLHKVERCKFCNKYMTDADSLYDNMMFDDDGFIYHRGCTN